MRRSSWPRFSPAELAFVEQRRTLPRLELLAAFRREFPDRDLTLHSLKVLCHRRGWLTGRTGQPKGFNRGYRWTKATAFSNARPQGSERVTGGYVRIKTGNGFVLKHRLLWERQNGPVPAGHILKCLDGNRANVDPSNWAVVSRAMTRRLNGNFGRTVAHDKAPPELRPALMAIARLEDAIHNKRHRNGAQCDPAE